MSRRCPITTTVYGAPKNTLAEGASLRVAAGLKPAETRGVAKFVNYVMGPEVQIDPTLAGGFLPMTSGARRGGQQAVEGRPARPAGGLRAAKGRAAAPAVRVSQIESVRRIVEEELESVWGQSQAGQGGWTTPCSAAMWCCRLCWPALPGK